MSYCRAATSPKWHVLGLLLGVVALVSGIVASPPTGVAAMSRMTDEGDVTASGALALDHMVYLPLVLGTYGAAPHATIFGVQMYGTLDDSHNAVSLARTSQAYWVRWPVSWVQVEPNDVAPGQYDWSSTDHSILYSTSSGQRVIATVTSAPSWAATYAQGPVSSAALPDFAEFVGELAERYDGDGYRDAPGSPVVDDFEFFNEPDSTNRDAAEQGYGSYYGSFGADYATMLCTVRSAIKASNSAARVILGGIAYDSLTTEGGSFNPDFLPQVLSHGGGACFDVMNFHYYPSFAAKWYAYGNGLQGKATYMHNLLAQYGYGSKPMVVTEAGWHSNHYSDLFPGSPEIQARYVVQLFTQAAAAHLESMIWWSWVDPPFPNGLNGLITTNLEPKPSLGVFHVAAERIGQAHFDHIVQTASSIEGYQFILSNGLRQYVFWTNDGSSHSMTLQASKAHIVDMYGNAVSWVYDSNKDGQLSVTFGANPVYVEAWP